MSAGDRWQEREGVNGEDPGVPQAIVLWMRDQGNAEQSVLSWEADTGDAVRPEAPDEGSASEEILDHLLRAIENTEVAARLQ
ncbi:MAG: hypothetical protein ACRD2G_07680, partial [Terriglobia bacterium]